VKTRLAAIAVEDAALVTKPFSTERRLKARWGSAGSTLSCRRSLWLRSIELHRAALLPVAASTMTAPVMCGCREQKYS